MGEDTPRGAAGGGVGVLEGKRPRSPLCPPSGPGDPSSPLRQAPELLANSTLGALCGLLQNKPGACLCLPALRRSASLISGVASFCCCRCHTGS